MKDFLYYYKAYVHEVYDADTITVDIDLGLGLKMVDQKIRLFGINAPEMRGPEKELGTISRDWLREKILKKSIILKTIKDEKGKFGRWLAEVWIDDVNLNKRMVEEGLAKEAHY